MKVARNFNIRWLAPAISCVGFIAIVPAANNAHQEQAAAPKSSPEMDRLKKLYLGTWDYTETYQKGATDSGVYTSEGGPGGGNSIVNRFHSKGEVGEFDGLLVITWDPQDKAYKSYVFGSEFPGCVLQTGQFEGDALVFRSEFAAGGRKLKLRNVTQLSAVGKILSEQYVTAEGAPEKLMVRVEAKRRP